MVIDPVLSPRRGIKVKIIKVLGWRMRAQTTLTLMAESFL